MKFDLEEILKTVDEVIKEMEPEINLIADAAYYEGYKEATGEELPVSEEVKLYISRSNAIRELQEWMTERGFDSGECNCSLFNDDGEYVGTVNIGWPYGIYGERGYTKPVAVQFYDTTPELLQTAKECAYEVFESIEEFKEFIEKYCIR